MVDEIIQKLKKEILKSDCENLEAMRKYLAMMERANLGHKPSPEWFYKDVFNLTDEEMKFIRLVTLRKKLAAEKEKQQDHPAMKNLFKEFEALGFIDTEQL